MDSESSNFTDRENFTSSSTSGNGDGDASNFECNICFELAQDPIVTLCGHLYCWPCLFRWLRLHSHSHECPVCKALIQEDKLVPLYGRGGTPTDPRSKPVPGVEIPNRPRPQPTPFPQESVNLNANLAHNLWGFLPVLGNFALLAGFGGMLPSIFSVQAVYNFGGPHGYPNGGYYNAAANQHQHNHHQHNHHQHRQQQQQQEVPADTPREQLDDNKLLVIFLIVILAAVLGLFGGW